jgi:peptidoglycan/LPS O-acetylase OafA/YrhL
MGRPLNDQNNFDLLRLVFASIVFLHHTYELTRHPDLRILTHFFSIGFALNAFFIISGFLVFMSFNNSRSIKEYALKRTRRIYPAYFSIIILCSALGIFITSLPITEYIREMPKYAAANLLFTNFLAPDLPGVFTNNPLQAINGALWTIRTEVMCYVCVPIIATLGKMFNRAVVFIGIYIAAYAVYIGLTILGSRTNSGIIANLPYLPWHFLCFLSGGILHSFFDDFKKHPAIFLLLALPAYSIGSLLKVPFLMPISLAVIIIYIACFFYYAGNSGKYGDLSYGVYIVHFPILQAMISQGIFINYPFSAFGFAVVAVVISSYISWHVVEKPFLQKSSHYVIAAERRP